ncbi:MAG: tetratricopeptide repeat protein [Chitinophagaceae bacterium]|nr:tetratricopeptide repeat protein [Chitinophagaceae bacterium]
MALLLTAGTYFFVRTTPKKKAAPVAEAHGPNDGHDHGTETNITADTILAMAKKQLSPDQVVRITTLENSISRGDVKDQQIHVYHQLAKFWSDSARIFEPWAWYTAEAARLENSEKSLTFAAQQFLDNLQADEVPERRKWKALQAKDLFERSLQINPANDSAKIGLGGAYLFGGISATPMEGILKVREVADKDSTNIYAQMMLGKGSLLSGQYDKALDRFLKVVRMDPKNLDACLLLGEVYERTGDKAKAISWYQQSLPLTKQEEVATAIRQRIAELKK